MKSRVSRGRVPATKEETMGYLRGIVHGAIIGGAIALLYAPKPGRQMREELSERLDQVRGQVQPVLDQAQGVVDTARPQVERVISKAQQQAQDRLHLAAQDRKSTRLNSSHVAISYAVF